MAPEVTNPVSDAKFLRNDTRKGPKDNPCAKKTAIACLLVTKINSAVKNEVIFEV